MKVEKMNEANEVKRALYGDYKHRIRTFAILTAENPMGKHLTPAQNNKRTSELIDICKHLHLQAIPIQGMFEIEANPNDRINYGDTRYGKKANGAKRPEHSFVLINPSFDDVAGIATQFEQLSFFWGENLWDTGTDTSGDKDITDNTMDKSDRHTGSIISYYEAPRAGEPYRLIERSRRIDNAADFDNFFSKHKDFKYSIYMKLFNEAYDMFKDVVDISCLTEALDDTYTTKHRAMRRAYAYNGKLL